MKKVLLSLIALFSLTLAQAQDPSKTMADSLVIHKVLIIPSSPGMLISDASAFIQEASHMTYPQLEERIRRGMAIAVRQSVPGWWESVLLPGDEDTLQTSEKIYASVAYRYDLLDEKTMGAKKDIMGKEKVEEPKPGISKGAVHIEKDTRPKFMNVLINKEGLLTELGARFQVDYFLFINEIDIKNDLSDYSKVGDRTYQRDIKVHYTIMDKSGKTFFAGLAVAQAPSEVNDVESLISGYFNKAAAKATSHLPPPEKVKRKGAPKN